MIGPPQAKTLVALGTLLLAMGEARAQIAVLERPDPGGVSVVQTLPYGTFTRSEACAAPGFKATLTLNPINFPGEYGGTLEAGDASISGAISKRETWQFSSSVDARSSYNMNIFADAVPGSTVRLRFQGSYQIGWSTGNVLENHAGFLFAPESGTAINGGVTKPGYLMPFGSLNNSEQFSVDLQASATQSTTEGGKTYYKLGNFSITGRGVLGSTNSGESVSYRAEISNFQADYRGPALTINGEKNHTWRVNAQLPQPFMVKVADGETSQAVPDALINFWVADPSKGGAFSNGGLSITERTNVNGLASVWFTLGASTGTYLINATCPAETCSSGARQVTFTAEAKGTRLDCEDCAWTGRISKRLNNPFRLKVTDGATGAPVAGAAVSYELLRFTDGQNTSSNFHNASVAAINGGASDIYGMSRAYLTLGTQQGVYVVRARCESCVGGQEQILTGIAVNRNVDQAAAAVKAGDPWVNAPGCQTGCCPLTPVLRAAASGKNYGSFTSTSVNEENRVELAAVLLPTCLNPGAVTWVVADAPEDYINSGTPAQPGPGQGSFFTVGSGVFPVANQGRPLPLAYKVTASHDNDGSPVTADVVIRQDEIDKCRQEYIDWSKPDKNLTALEYFSRYIWSDFSIGVDGVNDPDYVKYIDCYAYIPPSRENDVETLRSKVSFPIDVISGYRSPRKNGLQSPAGVWNSVHQFGGAVDIVPSATTDEERAARFKELWYKTSCPKALERSGAKVMAVCDVGQSTSTYKSTYNESNVFGLANCIHLGD